MGPTSRDIDPSNIMGILDEHFKQEVSFHFRIELKEHMADEKFVAFCKCGIKVHCVADAGGGELFNSRYNSHEISKEDFWSWRLPVHLSETGEMDACWPCL